MGYRITSERIGYLFDSAGADTITMDKINIFKKIYKRILVDNTNSTTAVDAKMNEFGINCGSNSRRCLMFDMDSD